jgi:aminoglycoside phosphotransferase (APT) family kinase protein
MLSVSKKFSVTVPDQIFELLEEWAEAQGRPTANLAAYLIESGLRSAMDKKEFVPKSKQDK